MHHSDSNENNKHRAAVIMARGIVQVVLVLLVSCVSISVFNKIDCAKLFTQKNNKSYLSSPLSQQKSVKAEEKNSWLPPNIEEESDPQILYGRALVMHTSKYLGPNGTVGKLSNGMNCQNCHLEAGTKVYGNNYAAVASTYPKFRPRSGQVESIEKRVRDCFERSLNGQAPADSSKEMQAIVSYIKWVGKDVVKGIKPEGTGIFDLPFLERAADPKKGKVIFTQKCVSCHGTSGEGIPNLNGAEYTYPPLWGKNSFNTGAGLFRLSRLAGYVRLNMPFGPTFEAMQLTDEESWDVAAFINSQPRPSMNIKKDWPDISKKPFDHPFGPYSDHFSEMQHKYGPFGPIKKGIKM